MTEQYLTDIGEAYDVLKDFALSLPETTEEFPWGESAIKVRGKTLLFLWTKEDRVTFTLKLLSSYDFALLHPFSNAMGPILNYGGWLQCRFSQGEDIPIDMLQEWVLQSYCAVAPKKLAKAVSQTEA